jgi:hypothetical protein
VSKRSYILLLLSLFAFLSLYQASNAETKQPKKFHFLGIAVNSKLPDNVVDNYAPDALKIEKIFKDQSPYEIESQLVLAKQATRKTVLNSIDTLAKQVRADDILFVYVGAHGTFNRIWGYAFYVADTYIWGSELEKLLKKSRGQVILLIDTCHSGGIIRDCEEFPVIASCREEESSYGSDFTKAFERSVRSIDTDVDENNFIELGEMEAALVKHLSQISRRQNVVYHNPDKVDLSLFKLL